METVVKATCVECGPVEMPASVVLVNSIPGLAWFGWPCCCGEYRTAETTRDGVALLLSGGVPLIPVHYPAELDEAHVGPVITEANVNRFVRMAEVLSCLAAWATDGAS